GEPAPGIRGTAQHAGRGLHRRVDAGIPDGWSRARAAAHLRRRIQWPDPADRRGRDALGGTAPGRPARRLPLSALAPRARRGRLAAHDLPRLAITGQPREGSRVMKIAPQGSLRPWW